MLLEAHENTRKRRERNDTCVLNVIFHIYPRLTQGNTDDFTTSRRRADRSQNVYDERNARDVMRK